MSAVEYTRCDNPMCGNLAPDPSEEVIYNGQGWVRIKGYSGTYDLCPDCAEKARKAVNLHD